MAPEWWLWWKTTFGVLAEWITCAKGCLLVLFDEFWIWHEINFIVTFRIKSRLTSTDHRATIWNTVLETILVFSEFPPFVVEM